MLNPPPTYPIAFILPPVLSLAGRVVVMLLIAVFVWMVLPSTVNSSAISIIIIVYSFWIFIPVTFFLFIVDFWTSLDLRYGLRPLIVCFTSCGRRMSSITRDFHSVCIECRGVDCDIDNRCIECTDVDDNTMTEYVKHKLSLRFKLMSKRKLKDPLLSATVVDDPASISDDPSSASPPAFIDSPSVSVDPTDFDGHVDMELSGVKTELVGQVRSLFANFAESLEDKFQQTFPE